MQILKDLRLVAGLTLREVQEKTGVSNAYLSQLETGKIKKPSATVLNKLAKLYGVSLDFLLDKSGKTGKPTILERLMELEEKVKNLEKNQSYKPELIFTSTTTHRKNLHT